MTATMLQIVVAIGMATVIFVAFMWLRSGMAAASSNRMMGMMTRVGLAPGSTTFNKPRTKAAMNETRRRCRNCPSEDLCERWLTGEVGGSNAFCPNASTFRDLAGTGG